MSKSILVIDTPTTCNKCPSFTTGNETLDTFCTAFSGKRKRIGTYDPHGIKRPDWCPLRDFPEKLDVEDYCFDSFTSFCRGYNTCIDEILESLEVEK